MYQDPEKQVLTWVGIPGKLQIKYKDQVKKKKKYYLILGKTAMVYLMLTSDIWGKFVQQALIDTFAGFFERIPNNETEVLPASGKTGHMLYTEII